MCGIVGHTGSREVSSVLVDGLKRRGALPKREIERHVRHLSDVPDQIRTLLEKSREIAALAGKFWRYRNVLYLGRGIQYPIAMEGALKLKEISYIHAEGYPAGEMKHGPNALIDENLPVVVLATRDETDPSSMTRYEKSVSNIKEVKARDGIVISVITEGDHLARE